MMNNASRRGFYTPTTAFLRSIGTISRHVPSMQQACNPYPVTAVTDSDLRIG